ncbi:MAG: DUF3416 domain-containing protein, partial [Alphaproteobacteria bacterium]|nr:DUF3416 domain-containing protein [Alphaproteobacteria bacterium]
MPATRFYYLHPLLAGPIEAWPPHLDRVAAMGFDAVVIAPPFATGAAGNLFLTADHDRLDPRLGNRAAIEALADWAAASRERGLQPVLDLVLDRVAVEHTGGNGLAAWYRADSSDEPPDPRQPPQRPGVARLVPDGDGAGAADWWAAQLTAWADAGVTGFRCLRPQAMPASLWRVLIGAVRGRHPESVFVASLSDGDEAEAAALVACGFDLTTCWPGGWGARIEEVADGFNRLARLAPPAIMVEAPFERRLGHDVAEAGRAWRGARRAIAFATTCGAGWLVPMGFEFGAQRALDPARDRPEDFTRLSAEPAFDLSSEIAAANRNAGRAAAPLLVRPLSAPDTQASALLLEETAAEGARLVLVNESLDHAVGVPLSPLLAAAGIGMLHEPTGEGLLGPDSAVVLHAAELRVYRAAAAVPVARHPVGPLEGSAVARVAIENVGPSVEDGRFAAKRLVGELVEVVADVVADGHDRVSAVLLWRRADEDEWREAPMVPTENDRWAGRFPLARLGRHVFTVLAWKDRFASFAEELEKKFAAGLPVVLELEEGRRLVEETAALAEPAAASPLAGLAQEIAAAESDERRRLLLSPNTAQLVAAARVRPNARQHPVDFPVEAERRAAAFGSWYELFPRSQSGDPKRHGTFADVIGRLPAIRAMGFDVVYFPPIHPIGRVNRKGRNNAPHAQPGDPGSPYAIGSVEGGHDAIHPELGTLADFRRLVAAAAEHGIEIALDFA